MDFHPFNPIVDGSFSFDWLPGQSGKGDFSLFMSQQSTILGFWCCQWTEPVWLQYISQTQSFPSKLGGTRMILWTQRSTHSKESNGKKTSWRCWWYRQLSLKCNCLMFSCWVLLYPPWDCNLGTIRLGMLHFVITAWCITQSQGKCSAWERIVNSLIGDMTGPFLLQAYMSINRMKWLHIRSI